MLSFSLAIFVVSFTTDHDIFLIDDLCRFFHNWSCFFLIGDLCRFFHKWPWYVCPWWSLSFSLRTVFSNCLFRYKDRFWLRFPCGFLKSRIIQWDQINLQEIFENILCKNASCELIHLVRRKVNIFNLFISAYRMGRFISSSFFSFFVIFLCSHGTACVSSLLLAQRHVLLQKQHSRRRKFQKIKKCLILPFIFPMREWKDLKINGIQIRYHSMKAFP